MKKSEYNTWLKELLNKVDTLIKERNVECSVRETEDSYVYEFKGIDGIGDMKMTFEKWQRASYHGKLNVLSVYSKYDTFRNEKGLLSERIDNFNRFNGKRNYHYFPEESDFLVCSLLKDLKLILKENEIQCKIIS